MKFTVMAFALVSMAAQAEHACDVAFHKDEPGCETTICREALVSDLADCWKQNMDQALDQRLLPLKKNNRKTFRLEMQMQKDFLSATEALCGKTCESPGTIKNISYHFCRVDAYKYRAAQAMQIQEHQLSIPLVNTFDLKPSPGGKEKGTVNFKKFTQELCQLPADVWKANQRPNNCQQSALHELDSYNFTDDVCDLS